MISLKIYSKIIKLFVREEVGGSLTRTLLGWKRFIAMLSSLLSSRHRSLSSSSYTYYWVAPIKSSLLFHHYLLVHGRETPAATGGEKTDEESFLWVYCWAGPAVLHDWDWTASTSNWISFWWQSLSAVNLTADCRPAPSLGLIISSLSDLCRYYVFSNI